MYDHRISTAFKQASLARNCKLLKERPHVVLDTALSWAGPFEHAFVKLIPENSRSIEAVCAWIARDAGLPCPEPRFVHVAKARLPSDAQALWQFGSTKEIITFGTIAIELAQPLTKVESTTVANIIRRWEMLELAGVFDLLIANDDRTEGNMLLDARSKIWLIDHGRALGGGGHRLFSSEVTPLIHPFLLNVIKHMPMPDRMKRKNALLAAAFALAACVPRVPYENLLVPPEIAHQIRDFLEKRAAMLPALVLEAAGLPDLYEGYGAEGTQ